MVTNTAVNKTIFKHEQVLWSLDVIKNLSKYRDTLHKEEGEFLLFESMKVLEHIFGRDIINKVSSLPI